MDRCIFPAIFEPGDSAAYVVSFPDLPGCYSQGKNLEEALQMAREALALHIYCLEEEGDEIPQATAPERIRVPKGAFVAPVDVEMALVRDEMDNKAMSKTVTLPRWLNRLAEERHINFSHTLQVALKERLGVSEPRRR